MNLILFVAVLAVVLALWIIDRVRLAKKVKKLSAELHLMRENEHKLLNADAKVAEAHQQAHALIAEGEALVKSMLAKSQKDVEAARAEARLLKQNARAYLEVVKKKSESASAANGE